MANPSLQIGNDNWAIKEDNLLGYSTAGTRFVPQPITMTRGSAGTRVNPSGLVETVELLGSELVDDGSFLLTGTQAETTTGTYWTTGVGWTISGGTANANTSGSYINFYQNNVFTVGKAYEYEFTVSNYSQGDVRFTQGGYDISGLKSANGTYTGVFSASQTSLYIQGANSFIGSIENVSVKEVTKNDLARVDYTDGTSSLLVEPERTNLVLRSQEIDNASWSKSSGGTGIQPVITADNVVSPDGVQNAEKVVFDLNGGGSGDESVYSLLTQNYTSVNGTTYSLSCYLKGESGGEQIIFDFDSANSNVVTLTNEWVRYTFSKTVSTNGSRVIRFGSRGNNSGGTYGSDNPTVYIWGAQLEVGSYATSYIPNFGTAAGITRAQDQYEKTGISDLIGSEGVLFVEMAALSNDGTNRGISLNDGTQTNRLLLYFSAASNQIAVISTGFTGSITYTLPDETLFNKIAVRYKANDITLWVDGDSRGTPIISATIPTFTAFKFDSGSASSPFFGKVKQLQIYDTYLSNGDMQTLTT